MDETLPLACNREGSSAPDAGLHRPWTTDHRNPLGDVTNTRTNGSRRGVRRGVPAESVDEAERRRRKARERYAAMPAEKRAELNAKKRKNYHRKKPATQEKNLQLQPRLPDGGIDRPANTNATPLTGTSYHLKKPATQENNIQLQPRLPDGGIDRPANTNATPLTDDLEADWVRTNPNYTRTKPAYWCSSNEAEPAEEQDCVCKISY